MNQWREMLGAKSLGEKWASEQEKSFRYKWENVGWQKWQDFRT